MTWKQQFFSLIVLLLRSSLYHLESTESIFAHRLGRPEGKANADSFVVRYVFFEMFANIRDYTFR